MICFKGKDFLLNNVTGDEIWSHPKQNCCISREIVVVVGGFIGTSALEAIHTFQRRRSEPYPQQKKSW
jgi:hypothetical protein